MSTDNIGAKHQPKSTQSGMPAWEGDTKQMKKLEKELRQKFKNAQEREKKHRVMKEDADGESVEEVEIRKPVDSMKKSIMAKFKKVRAYEQYHDETREKMYEPITSALEKVEAAVDKVKDGVNQTDENLMRLGRNQIMTLLPSTPSSPNKLQLPSPNPISPSIAKTIRLGPIAKEYLPRANDDKFGIWYDKDNKKYKIGSKIIKLHNDDITIDDTTYKGTVGLWRLLTYTNAPNIDLYTQEDLNQYKNILFTTDSVYHHNDRNTNKPKSSTGQKYISLIKNIYTQFKQGDIDEHIGKGILKYEDKMIEYKYITNLSELMKRLQYLYAQEQAGNNNFHNEKLGIINFIKNSLENIVDSPKALEYLIRIVPSLPKGLLKEGSGLFNDLINNLPFEIHAPGYSYLGPGTKLDERLNRGDQPINKLDAAAKDHDIFYKNHKNTKARHQADHVLEHRAWERVLDPDANLNEKSWAWVTTNAMKAKRYFGLGLKF